MNIILGPPGTGKTTRLLRIVDYALSMGADPEKIGYFSFTKKAAEEAIDRACKQFERDREEFTYFRTLHSLAFKTLGLGTGNVMNGRKVKEFAEIMGLEVSNAGYNDMTGAYEGITKDDRLLFLEQFARATGRDHRSVWNDLGDTSWFEFDKVVRGLQKFKQVKGLRDFTDMLVDVSNNPALLPSLDLLVIDEAQDLSAMQWKVVDQLIKKAKKVFIAGDDDQAIFNWAGADVQQFIHKEGHVEVLDHSYRLPKAVYGVAQKITERIQNRRPKTWKCRDEEGNVSIEPNINCIDMSEGSWLVLARNKFCLDYLEEDIREKGYFYQTQKGWSVDRDLLRAIIAWERTRKGGQATKWEIELIDRYVGNREIIRVWHKVFIIPETTKQYIISLLRNGENLLEEPRIKLSTIHGAKGGEADNVVICQDASRAVSENNTSDDEARVAYVAVTRARQNLFLLEPASSYTLLDNFDIMFK